MTVENLLMLIPVLGIVIAYQSYLINKQKYQSEQKKELKSDAKSDAEKTALISAQLGHISKGVDDIRIDIKSNEKQMAQMAERITRVEESSKQAHKRIDKLEEEI